MVVGVEGGEECVLLVILRQDPFEAGAFVDLQVSDVSPTVTAMSTGCFTGAGGFSASVLLVWRV